MRFTIGLSMPASMFGRYLDAARTVSRLKGMVQEPDLQSKFDEVLAAMGDDRKNGAATP
jgi:hypothetical protein